jgi:GNAT superfamily N-acetyltransferase
VKIVEIVSAEQKSKILSDILKTLPEWFGIPTSNEHYVSEAISKDVFVIYDNLDQPVGLIALRYHFQTTAEIWWMGVKPEYHRRGIGTLLFEAARSRAKENGCRSLAVMTLSPRSPYLPYARTRAFYERQGFRLLLEVNERDPQNPLAWMTMEVRRVRRSPQTSDRGLISD